jgi:cysteine synthase B
MSRPDYPTIDQTIGRTPLVRLQRLPGEGNASRGNVILAKLEGQQPGWLGQGPAGARR